MRSKRLTSFCLVVAAVVCGAVVMSVELLGARMLSVAYGGSLTVWAAMISVTLLSLAVGYFLGGWLADKYPRPALLGACLVVTGVLLVICPHTDFVLRGCYRAMGLRGGALASSAAIFFLPLGLMGMVSPFVIRMLCAGSGGKRVGMTAGSVYAISTVGSVLGTLLTGLWMIPAFGTAAGFRTAAVAVAVVGAVLIVAGLGLKGSPGFAAALALAFVPGPAARVGEEYTAPDGGRVKVLAVRESAHGHITVLEKGDYRLLVVNGIVQTGVPLRFRKGQELKKNRYFQELLPYMVDDPRRANALIIGLAGGMTASILMVHEMDVDSVDIDPEIIEVAREYFRFSGKATAADGRRFLEDCRKKYDFCVIDTYSGDVFPFHLASKEAFAAAKKVLKPRGVLAMNYIGSPKGKAFACLYLTVGKVFKHLLAIRGEEGDDVQTITLFASDRQIRFNRRWQDDAIDFIGSTRPDPVIMDIQRLTVAPPAPQGAFVLTDDHNPIDFLRAEEALRWRERTVQNIGRGATF